MKKHVVKGSKVTGWRCAKCKHTHKFDSKIGKKHYKKQ